MSKAKRWSTLLCCLLTAGLLLTSCQRQAAPLADDGVNTDAEVAGFSRIQQDFSGIPYTRPDLDALNADADQALALTKQSGKKKELLDLYQKILTEMQNVDTMDSLASIRNELDLTDEYYEKEKTDLDEFLTKFDNRMNELTGAILDSEYADAAKAAWGDAFIARYEQNSKLNSPAIEDLSKQEQDLVTEYQKLSVQDYTTELDGKTVTLNDLDLSTQKGVQAYYEIYAKRNKELGEIYRELVQIRVEIAKKLGYDNYTDYAYDVLGRDYTKEDAAAFSEQVKKVLAPISAQIEEKYSGEMRDANAKVGASFDKAMPILEKALKNGGYPAMMQDALDYMKTYHMYDYSGDPNKMQAGFSTLIGSTGAPFMFINTSVYTDASTLFHEFGHYYNFYRTKPPVWNDQNNLDVAEIHSQGFELLMHDTYDELYGPDYAEAMRIVNLYNILGSVVQGCAEDEFQQKVFENPDMSLDEMNALHAKISKEYMGYPILYEWVDIHHHYETPFYYISYATSAISALEIWEIATTDRPHALEVYDRITRYTLNDEYRQALKASGLSDPFSSDCVNQIARALDTELSLGDSGLDQAA